MKPTARIDLPPEAADLYQSGATIQTVANAYGCSYDGARNWLGRAGVQFRQHRPDRTQPQWGRCPDCGEDRDRPHVLGTHLPGCRREKETS